MKNKMQVLSIVIICYNLIVQCATTTTIDLKQRVKTVGEVNVRSGPGLEHKIITTVPEGTSLVLVETENDWYKVKLPDGKSGWIFQGLTNKVNSEKIVITNQTYIRKGPGVGYKTFAVLVKGKTFDLIGEQGSWYKVMLPDGNTGWIAQSDARKVERQNITTTQNTVVYQEADKNSREIIRINKGTELIQLDRNGSWYLIRVTEGVEGWIHESAVKPVPEQNLTVPEKANIRRGPGQEYDIIETVSVNTNLTEIERRGDWLKIRTPSGEMGWVYKAVITPSKNGGSTEAVSKDYVITNQDCNIRQGYSLDFKILLRAKKGTILQIIEKKDDWLRIKFPPDGSIGWIRNDLIEYNPTILFTNRECNIRQGYSTTFERIRRVGPATPLAKIGEQSSWYRVYLPDGVIGWLRNDLVSNAEDILVTNQDCNVRQGYGTDWKKIGDLKAGTVVTKLKKQNDWYRIQQPNGDIGWIRQDMLISLNDYKQTLDEVNIRTGAGTDQPLLKKVSSNTGLLKISSKENWYQVRLLSGELGWIRNDLTTPIFFTGNDVGQSLSTSSHTAKPGTKNTKITTKTTDIRICPKTECSVTQTVKKGTELIIVGQQGSWYEIQLPDGNFGYVNKSDFIGSLLETNNDLFYTREDVRLRKGPGTTYDIITTLPGNTSVEKLEEYKDWYYVKLDNGKQGWIHSPLVIASISSTSGETWKSEDIDVDFGNLRTIGAVNVYSEPNTKSQTIKTFPNNSRLVKVGKKSDWFQVQLDDMTFGWVPANVVQDNTFPTVITITQTSLRTNPQPTSTPLETISLGAEFNPLDEFQGWYSVKTATGKGGWIDAKNTALLKFPKIFTKENSRVRQAPITNAPILAVLGEGTELKPIAKSNEWFFIALPDGKLGWIHKDVIKKPQYPNIKIVTNTNAYRDPSVNSEKIATLLKNDKFQTAEKQGDWYQIYLRGGDVGWVYHSFLEEISLSNLLIKNATPIRDGPGDDYSIAETITPGKEVKCIEEDGIWCKILTADRDVGWLKKEDAKTMSFSPLLTIKQTYIRSGPDIKYTTLKTLEPNSEITPISMQGDWYEVKLSETQKGWVHKDDFVNKAKSRYVFTLDLCNIRNGPGTNYQIIKSVDPATDLLVIGEDGDWYNVKLTNEGLIGWVKKDYVFE